MSSVNQLTQKTFFRLRERIQTLIQSYITKLYWSLQGAKINSKTRLLNLNMTWPHQVMIGKNCVLEKDIYFKFDGIWCQGPSIIIRDRVFIGKGCEFNIRQTIDIGNDCLIGSGCKFIDHEHGLAILEQPINKQPGAEAPIILEENVWLGVNVVVLKGVTIGKGAVVGAGAVVTKSIPPYEIWVGVPAKKLRQRY